MKKRLIAVIVSLIVIAISLYALNRPATKSASTNPPSPRPTYVIAVHDSKVGLGTQLNYGKIVSDVRVDTGVPPTADYNGPTFLIALVQSYTSDVTPTNGKAAPAGDHYVAAFFIAGNYASTLSTATLDVVGGSQAIDEHGATYSAVTDVELDSSHPLFPPGKQSVKGGGSISGWLVFAVPKNVTVGKIHVAPFGNYDGSQASWDICDISHPSACR